MLKSPSREVSRSFSHRQRIIGGVMIEYIVVTLFASIGVYLALFGTSLKPSGDTAAPTVATALHNRQTTFIDAIRQP